MKFSALLILVLIACGDDIPDLTRPHSGFRLKLIWYEYDGGARELERGWYFDRVLDERCTPTAWGDGGRYCAPATDEAVYVNETCTRALGRTLVGSPPAPFFATTFKGARASVALPSRLFRRGQPTTSIVVTIWQKTADGCIRMETSDNFEYFDLGDEVPVADLVRLHRSEPYGSGDLAVIAEIGEDELRDPVALYDRLAGAECTAAETPNAISIPCVPLTTAISTPYYLDPACTKLVVNVPDGTTPRFASLEDEKTICSSYYRVGRNLSLPAPQLLFELNGATCGLAAWPGEQHFFELETRVFLPALGRVRDSGTQRIRAIERVSGALQLPDPLMYDAELDTECQHDEELACVPRAAGSAVPATSASYYADAQCQTAIGLAFVPRGSCDPTLRFASDGSELFELREPYTKPIYTLLPGGACTDYVLPERYVAYSLGAQIDRSRFAHAELVIDP